MALGFASAVSSAGFEVARGVVAIGYDDEAVEAGLARTEASTRRGMGLINKLVVGFGVGLAAASVEGAKLATDFDAQMTLIQTAAGGTAKDVKYLRQQVLDLARDTPQSPEELAKALYHLKSLGYDNRTAMRALRAGVDGAATGMADLEAVTNALGATIRTGIRDASNFHDTMGILNAIVGAGNMRMDDLTDAIATGVLPTAKLAGLGLKDVGAALTVMTDEAMPAQVAASRLRTAIFMIANPSHKAEKALNQIGLSGTALAYAFNQPRGLLKALEMLHDHLANVKGASVFHDLAVQVQQGSLTMDEFLARLQKVKQFQILASSFGGARAAASVILLANQIGLLKQKYDQIDRSSGKFSANVKAAMDTAKNKMKSALSEIQVGLIALGSVVLPVIVSIAQGIAKIAAFLLDHAKAVKILAGIVGVAAATFLTYKGAVLVAAAATKLYELWVLRAEYAQLLLNAAMDANPFVLIASLVAMLVTTLIVLYQTNDRVRHALQEGWRLIKSAVGDALAFIIRRIADYISIQTALLHFVGKLPGPLGAPFRAAADAGDRLISKLHGVADALDEVGSKHEHPTIDVSVRYVGPSPSALSQTGFGPGPGMSPPEQSLGDATRAAGRFPVNPKTGLPSDVDPFKNTPQLPAAVKLAQARARLTKSATDDLAADQKALAFLNFVLKSKRLTDDQRADILNEIADVNSDMATIRKGNDSGSSGSVTDLPSALRLRAARAAMTKTQEDDLKSLYADRNYLYGVLRRKKLAESDRADVLQAIADVDSKISDMQETMFTPDTPASITEAEAKSRLTKTLTDDLAALKRDEKDTERRIAAVKKQVKDREEKAKLLTTLYNKLADTKEQIAQAIKDSADRSRKAELSAQIALSYLQQRSTFFDQYGGNIYRPLQESGATQPAQQTSKTVVVHQHFQTPTNDKNREARYARFAMESAFDG